MTSSTIDLSALALSFRDHPIATASSELVESHWGDLEDLACTLSEGFTAEGEWCRIGDDFHTVTMGSAETRLHLREEAEAWHADLFHAGWQTTRTRMCRRNTGCTPLRTWTGRTSWSWVFLRYLLCAKRRFPLSTIWFAITSLCWTTVTQLWTISTAF